MSTKVQVGRRYCRTADGKQMLCVHVYSDGTGCLVAEAKGVPQVFFSSDNHEYEELPPPEGGFYAGEKVEVRDDGAWHPATYVVCVNGGCSHVVIERGGSTPFVWKHCRRPVPTTIRRTPTDQDAIDVPRRPCWVREDTGHGWSLASLRVVLDMFVDRRYVAEVADSSPCAYRYCEIEVPNED